MTPTGAEQNETIEDWQTSRKNALIQINLKNMKTSSHYDQISDSYENSTC
jgi:hypothetical protein